MKGIEFAPFRGDITRLGDSHSADSAVMLLHNKVPPKGVDLNVVLKWNRSIIGDEAEACSIIKFTQLSLALYRAALGAELIIPTQFIVGAKKDNSQVKIKVYEVQPYISGWDGRSLPEDLRHDERLVDQWRRLYSRLSLLYIVADNVNRQRKHEGKDRFPINITVGNSRRAALSGMDDSMITVTFPRTPNILIDRESYGLHLCDFGPYTPWRESMKTAYQTIFDRTLKAIESVEGSN